MQQGRKDGSAGVAPASAARKSLDNTRKRSLQCRQGGSTSRKHAVPFTQVTASKQQAGLHKQRSISVRDFDGADGGRRPALHTSVRQRPV